MDSLYLFVIYTGKCRIHRFFYYAVPVSNLHKLFSHGCLCRTSAQLKSITATKIVSIQTLPPPPAPTPPPPTHKRHAAQQAPRMWNQTKLSRGYKKIMLNSAEHEILNVHKYIKISRNSAFLCSDKPRIQFFLLINVKMPTIVGIFYIYKQEKYHAQLS